MSSAVSNLDGVYEVDVEGSGETTLSYDPSEISLAEIEKVISELGYEIRK